MSLDATIALITVDELISSMGLSRNDIQIDCFSIYNSSSDATAATIAKSGNTLTLVVTGGANAGTSTIDLSLAANDTIGELVAVITALAKGWVVNRYCSSAMPSTAMFDFGAEGCLLIANEYVPTAFDQLMLEQLINSASQFISTYCRRKFVSQEHTEYRDGNGYQDLHVREFPINTFTSLALWEYSSQSVLYTYTVNEEYEVYTDQGRIYKIGGFACGRKNYKVVYTAGYSADDMPEDLKDACKQMAKLLYFKRDKQNVASERIGRYAISYAKDGSGNYLSGIPVPPEIIAGILPYKRKDRLYYK